MERHGLHSFIEINRLVVHRDYRSTTAFRRLALRTFLEALPMGPRLGVTATRFPTPGAQLLALGWRRTGLRFRYHSDEPRESEVLYIHVTLPSLLGLLSGLVFKSLRPRGGDGGPAPPLVDASLARRVLGAWLAMSGPHDLFARYTFGHPERAAAELRAVLPAHVVSEVDWASLRREPGSVVDPELRETESDLLFKARLRSGQPLLLYVLLEHQSSVDRWMALRMLRYVVRQVERWRQEHPKSERLPVIIPLVMYHGPDGAWTAPRRVEELFELPGEKEGREQWRALVPRFEYLLDDLTAERVEALSARPGPPLARLAWLVLRYGRSEELARKLPDWERLFAHVQADAEGAEHLVVITRYLVWMGNEAVHEAVRRVLHSVLGGQRAEELMRSYGEQLIERGLQQGREEGLRQGLEKGLRQGLEKGLRQGLEKGREEGLSRGRAEAILRLLAARGVQADEAARQRILSCTDVATLDRWFDRALHATTLSDVLAQ